MQSVPQNPLREKKRVDTTDIFSYNPRLEIIFMVDEKAIRIKLSGKSAWKK